MTTIDQTPATDLQHPLHDRGLILQAGIKFEGYSDTGEDRRDTEDLAEAQVVTSRVAPPKNADTAFLFGLGAPPEGGWHFPVIDVDLPVTALPSSSLGHSHLYIDHPMPWEDLLKLLRVMAEVGIVEEGYLRACEARGYTAIRLPWVKKDDQDADLLSDL